MCHIKFKNTLPDPPVDFKVVKVLPDLSPSIAYTSTALERDYKYRVPGDVLHSKLVDFVDLEALKPDMSIVTYFLSLFVNIL